VTRRIALAAGLGLVFAAAFLFGAFAADPLRAVRKAGEAVFRASSGHEEIFAASDGTPLHAFVLGPLSAERPVVLLHGLGADASYWAVTARFLAARGRTVIVPDAPGSGASGTPGSPEGLALPARVAAVESMAVALGLSSFDLVGHSLGGLTAGLYALEHPRRVRRLVLVDAAGFSRFDAAEDERVHALGAPRDRAGARRLVDLLFFRKPLPAIGAVADALARNYLSPNVRTTVEVAGQADLLLGREGELPEGTTLIWGAEETLLPLRDARAALGRIRGGRLFVVTGVGHDTPLEAPRAFQEALLEALGG
jgi:pimeloyl-ACP methyl ester carboxylesterase